MNAKRNWMDANIIPLKLFFYKLFFYVIHGVYINLPNTSLSCVKSGFYILHCSSLNEFYTFSYILRMQNHYLVHQKL